MTRSIPVIAIFDIGRTNKKFVLFNQRYEIVAQEIIQFAEIQDNDGAACQDIRALARWMKERLAAALANPKYEIRAINFSAHGASFVHIGENGEIVAPLYDYMKPLSAPISRDFYALFGGKKYFSAATGSPALDMLNSGVQLYWLKYAKPQIFEQIAVSLHLPQFANYLFSGATHADYTCIGCHTGLWNYGENQYHQWLKNENIRRLLPAAEKGNSFDLVAFGARKIPVGIGLHDSSASLAPFLKTAAEPFVLLSSGTWNITLNPFFEGALTPEKYEKDCLYFLSHEGENVAAARIFLGNEYQHQVRKLQKYFYGNSAPTEKVLLSSGAVENVLKKHAAEKFYPETMCGTGPFPDLAGESSNLAKFDSYAAAHCKMLADLVHLQCVSLRLVSENIKRLYISGGFIKNVLFLELLQAFLPDWELFIVENEMTSAIGAAALLHEIAFGKPLAAAPCAVRKFASSLKLRIG